MLGDFIHSYIQYLYKLSVMQRTHTSNINGEEKIFLFYLSLHSNSNRQNKQKYVSLQCSGEEETGEGK